MLRYFFRENSNFCQICEKQSKIVNCEIITNWVFNFLLRYLPVAYMLQFIDLCFFHNVSVLRDIFDDGEVVGSVQRPQPNSKAVFVGGRGCSVDEEL